MKRRAVFQSRICTLGLALWMAFACQTAESRALEAGRQKLLEGQARFSSPEGITALRESAQLFAQAGSAAKRAEALYWLAHAEREAKNFGAALAAIEAAQSAYAGEAGFYDTFEAELLIGELQTELGEHRAARTALTNVRAKAIASKSRWNQRRSVSALAKLEAKDGAFEAARAAWAEDVKGIAWEFSSRQNRTLIEELEKLASEVHQKLADENKPEPVAPDVLREIRRLPGGKVVLARSLVERWRKEPELLLRGVRVVPGTKDSQIVGVWIFGVRPDTLWGALGFENGDQLKTLNGHAAADLLASKSVPADLRTASNVKVAISRRRVAQELEFIVE
jgi:hypothetical protein